MRAFNVAVVALASTTAAATSAPTSAPSVTPTVAATTAQELTQLVLIGLNTALMVVLALLLVVIVALVAVVLVLVAKYMTRPPPLPDNEDVTARGANDADRAAESGSISDQDEDEDEDATNALNPVFELRAATSNGTATAKLEMGARNGAAASAVSDASRLDAREDAPTTRARRRSSTASARTVAARERVRERRASFADQRAREAAERRASFAPQRSELEGEGEE